MKRVFQKVVRSKKITVATLTGDSGVTLHLCYRLFLACGHRRTQRAAGRSGASTRSVCRKGCSVPAVVVSP